MDSPATSTNKLPAYVIRTGIVVTIGTIMAILDTTIVSVALDTLARDFHTSISTIQWVTTGYLLALAVVIPISGWGVHRIGAKPLYLASIAIFVIGSVLCGFAWSATSLIAFRILQGIGGGMIMPVGQSIMAQTAGPKNMGKVMSIIGIPTMLGPILGPVIGGAIVSNVSWRWIFFVNVPIGILGLVLGMKFLAKSPRDNDHRFDLVGFLLLSPGLAILIYGLSAVGSNGGFSTSSIGEILVGLVLMAGFVLRSLRAPEPLVDMRLFKNRTFSIASISIFLTGATLYGTMFLLPLYYQIVRGESAWMAGLLMAPQGIGAALVMKYSGTVADRFGPRRVVPLGIAIMALGTFAYTQVSTSTSYWLLAGGLFVRGIGLGFGMMPAFAASYRELDHHAIPRASTATNIIRQVGGSIAVALFAVVLQTQITHRLGSHASLGSVPQSAIPEPVLVQLAGAFATSFWWSFATVVLAIIPGLFLPKGAVVTTPAVESEPVLLD